jgi:hypothetical protein
VRVIKFKKIIAVMMLLLIVFGMFDLCMIRESLAAAPLVLTADAILYLGTACVAGGMVFTSAEDMSALITEVWNRASKGLKQKVVDSIAIGSVFLGDKWSELISIIRDIRQEFHDGNDIISSQPWVGNYILENKDPRGVLYRDYIGSCGEQLGFEWTVTTLKLDINLGHSYNPSSMSGKAILSIVTNGPYSMLRVRGGKESGGSEEIYDRVFEGYKINMILSGLTGDYGVIIRNSNGDIIKSYEGCLGSVIDKQLYISYRYAVSAGTSSESVYLTGTQDYAIPSTACTYDDVLDWPARPGELEQKKVGIPLELGDLLGKTADDLTYDNYIDAPGVDLGAESEIGWLQNVYNGIKALPSSIAQAIAAQFAITVDVRAEMNGIKNKFNRKLVGFDTDISSYIDMQDSYDCPVWKYNNPYSGEEYVLINWCEYEEYVGKFKRWLSGILVVMTLAACYQIIKVKVVID